MTRGSQKCPAAGANSKGSHESVSIGGISLTSSGGIGAPGAKFSSMSREGISLGVLISGNVDVTFDKQKTQSFTTDDGFLLSCNEPIEMVHAVKPDIEARIVFLSLAQNEDTDPAVQQAIAREQSSADWGLRQWRPNANLLTLAKQIVLCPYQGHLREIYLQGKALEMLSVTLGSINDATSSDRSHSRRMRLLEAREILLAEYRTPPTLDELARRVGTCTTVLTAEFRRMFGASVTEFVQEERLKSAYESLRSGQQSVAQAAYSVGLSPSYFSTVFRRRFGFSPSVLSNR